MIIFLPTALNYGYSLSNIEPLNGSNFNKWKENVELYLGLLGIDICLREPQPIPDDQSTDLDHVKYREWERTDRMTKLILKQTMSPIVRGSVAEPETALEYMTAIGQKFIQNEKAEIHLLLDKLTGTQYDPAGSVRELNIDIIRTTTRLGDLNVVLPDAYIIHVCFKHLPASFAPLRTAYFAQKEQWDLNELIAICVQEEELLKS
ncbi:uncharacterized protein LOC133727956 [Rosa rugosa]|uniref:uncharacterized protein LOC133727956 n=1 Tax=Rosa rugosa TaxID=74645 RepID=UPI002B40EA90|nr:uncharacterized protein LOC133727956 [Rosa rugosa]